MLFCIVCLGLFFPLLGFLIISCFSFVIGRKTAQIISCGTVFFSFLLFLIFLIQGDYPKEEILYKWIPVERIDAKFSLVLDTLSLLMALLVTGIGFLIHLYSIGYMDHEKDFARYFACMNFFIFSMLLLVLAGDLLLLYVGWEGVGLASYLLIGFWYEKKPAANAGTKAFIVNRIGDFGLLLGIMLLMQISGFSNIEEMTHRGKLIFAFGAPLITIATLLFFLGACGKSAQIPLHIWLPDAMEGPTPVSALIHAATMVTAGVYLIVRLEVLFILAPTTLVTIAIIGLLTSLFASFCAAGQSDLKRVLAYSTISQLGLMFISCGIGAFYAATFHLATHAFIKALLFLSAGNIIHMLNGVTEMHQMGGLRKVLPKTHILFLIGVLAMSGVPPFAAFFSKELIIEQEHLIHANLLLYGTWLISIMTGYYLMRAYLITFYGNINYTQKIEEAPKIMWMPLTVLAFLSLVAGLFGVSATGVSVLEQFLKESGVIISLYGKEPLFQFSIITLLSTLAIAFGLFLAVYLFRHKGDFFFKPPLILKNAFYIDQFYRRMIAIPLKKVSTQIVVYFEPFFEKMIDQSADSAQTTGKKLQLMQSGQIRSYGAWMAIGTAFLLLYLVIQ